jgi:hypothetical protein
MISEARVATVNGERYASQLCKHAAHMGPRVEWNPPNGTIEFPDEVGTCRLTVWPDSLVLSVESKDPANLAKMQRIIGDDIKRFAYLEGVKVAWGNIEPQA